MEIIEYLRKSGRKPKRDDEGKIIIKGAGVGRQKKGVFYCAAADSDSVMIGFSLCNKLDSFDYVNGQYEPGFGLELAKSRAKKWIDYTGYFIQNSWTEDEIEDGEYLIGYVNPDTKSVVEIPPSIIKPLQSFIKRCKRYYQDKEFPAWTEMILLNQPEEVVDFINYTLMDEEIILFEEDEDEVAADE